MRPSNSKARLPEVVAEIEVIPYDSPLCGDEEFLYYVRLQASRVRAALRRDEDVAAGLHVLVRSCMSGSESAVFVEILGRSPDGEPFASDFDPHPYLAVRGAFDRLLALRLRGPLTSARAEADRGSGRHEAQEHVVAAEVSEIIAERLAIEPSLVTFDAVLFDDLGATSRSMLELALAFEETFDIDLPDNVVEQLRTVFDAVRCVWRALSRRTSESQVAVGW